MKKVEELLEENKENIWEQYQKAKEHTAKDRKEWKTGETMWIDGEKYLVCCKIEPEKKANTSPTARKRKDNGNLLTRRSGTQGKN